MGLYKVKDKYELRKIIEERKISLEKIDTALLRDMSYLFKNVSKINGSIASWNVSSVTSMYGMFYGSTFHTDISNWDTSKVKNMSYVFCGSTFNGDIGKWNVGNVTDMEYMFQYSKFNQDISSWDISNVTTMRFMFGNSNFNRNLGAWDLSEKNINYIFENSTYTCDKYAEDRKEYLNDLELEKEKINNQYLLEEQNKLNKELNKEIELKTLDMEF